MTLQEVARQAARNIRQDAIEDGHDEPCSACWEFWLQEDEEDVISSLPTNEYDAVVVAFAEGHAAVARS